MVTRFVRKPRTRAAVASWLGDIFAYADGGPGERTSRPFTDDKKLRARRHAVSDTKTNRSSGRVHSCARSFETLTAEFASRTNRRGRMPANRRTFENVGFIIFSGHVPEK